MKKNKGFTLAELLGVIVIYFRTVTIVSISNNYWSNEKRRSQNI